MRPSLLLRLAVLACIAKGCDGEGGTNPPMPPAEVFDEPSDFAGEWIGEVEATEGTLVITKLAPDKYRGIYEVEGMKLKYVLAMSQTMVDVAGTPTASNRVTFTWQDGRGGRGVGWLLINRERTALTGEFGEGAGHSGGGWTFIRVE